MMVDKYPYYQLMDFIQAGIVAVIQELTDGIALEL